MLVVHHLNDSRSQRILWLLEEIGMPYEIKRYQRNAETRFAPPELKTIHPLGKSPVITDDGLTMAESGAIIDYLLRKDGSGALQPSPESAEYNAYREWLHYAEGSAMRPLLLHLSAESLGEAGAPLRPRIESEIALHLGYVDGALKERQFLVGNQLTGADIQMSFVADLAGALNLLSPFRHLEAWADRLQARPAFKRAIEKGGSYRYVRKRG